MACTQERKLSRISDDGHTRTTPPLTRASSMDSSDDDSSESANLPDAILSSAFWPVIMQSPVISPKLNEAILPVLEIVDKSDGGLASPSKLQTMGDEPERLVHSSEAPHTVHIYDEPESYTDDGLENETSLISSGPEPRRKALLIGIKYDRNPRVRSLEGPHHDVEEVKKLLHDVYGWDEGCFRTLKDGRSPPKRQPTLKNIKYELRQLVEGAQTGDHLFFYFSGHGSQVKDLDGDELDGRDEVLVASDGKFLIDDDLHDILVRPLPARCRLTALLDCCSSGTGLDLPYDTSPPPKAITSDRPFVRKHSNGNVILLAACEDAERAYEKQDDDKRVRGMLTLAFINSLKTRKKSTYDELLASVRGDLHRSSTMQKPQLSSSQEIDLNAYFDL
ncbi:caspase domain-containing protein [Phellopilus nigrolimitatus]|nr:caspase domain-containing protein [Phellopilus nigrolimitatus]